MNALYLADAVMLALAFLVTLAWPIHYHIATKGGWWRDGDPDRPNVYGRNLMGLAVVLALMLGFTLIGRWVPLWLLACLALVLYGGTLVVIGHRHILLWRSQHRRRQ